MKALLVLVVLAPLLVAAPAVAVPAGAAPTCRGEAATIVGVQGEVLTGTEGDDVIVTNGAKFVDALGGADLVCVTGDWHGPNIVAGDGDDLVDTTAWRHGVTTQLGDGEDTLVGGAGRDLVDDGGAPDSRDVINTGGGDDAVTADVTDIVRLGPGNDGLGVRGTTADDADLHGDGGSDSLSFNTSGPASAPLEIYNRRGQAVRGGVPVMSWHSFERFSVEAEVDRFSFRGTNRSESVAIGFVGRPVVDVEMGGGADTVGVTHRVSGHVDGGTGSDGISLTGRRGLKLVADLGEGTAREYGPGGLRQLVDLRRLEDVEVWDWSTAVVVGDDRPNVLSVPQGCRTTLRGGGGADVLERLRGAFCKGGKPSSTMVGGDGPDRLLGYRIRDLLVGGRGRDVADGGDGNDTCRAEVRRHCERS